MVTFTRFMVTFTRFKEMVAEFSVRCRKCNKPADSYSFESDVLADTITLRVRCHGRRQKTVLSVEKLAEASEAEVLANILIAGAFREEGLMGAGGTLPLLHPTVLAGLSYTEEGKQKPKEEPFEIGVVKKTEPTKEEFAEKYKNITEEL